MEKTQNSANQQSKKSTQNGNEITQNQERSVCSPEFPDGCIDVETGETEN
ncbi:hypothetical protein [Konateibacter massiliensis]|nr:hypothetical protein [Konateibacter massiliensis]